MQLRPLPLQPGEVEDVAHQPVQPVRLAVQRVQVLLLLPLPAGAWPVNPARGLTTRAVASLPPAPADGSFRFVVMGDNRGNSEDSRRFGPVRRSTVVGRTVFRIWPIQKTAFL